MRDLRHPLGATITAVVAVTLGEARSTPAQPQFRAAVTYVEIPVRVTDGSGRFAGGLTADAFNVSEAGVAQAVVTFEEVHLTSRLEAKSQSRSGAAPVSSSTQRAAYFILVDDSHIGRDATARVQSALEQFIERQVQPGDLVGIGYVSGVAGQDLTTDRSRLKSAVTRLHGSYDPQVPKAEQERLALRAIGVVGRVADALQPEASRRPTAMLLVTAGIGCVASPRASDGSIVLCGSTLTEAVQRATFSGVAVYGLDLAGSVNPHYDGAGIRARKADSTLDGAEPPRGSENGSDAMRVLASDTGGFALFNSDNPAAALARVAEESGSYYRIGYYSSHDRSPDKIGTDIVVDVTRPGLHAFHARQRPRPVSVPSELSRRSPDAAPESTGPQVAVVELSNVLTRAADYLVAWQQTFGSVLLEERLSQQVWRPQNGVEANQTTTADLLLFRRASCQAMVTYRDVYEAGGRRVRDHDERLRKLFVDSPSTAPEDAFKIANESSRYNIGSTFRNIDVPTFAFLVLARECQTRFTFKRGKDEDLDGVRVWRVDYRERARPTIIRTLMNEPLPIEGTIGIEPASGRIVQTLVKTEGTPDTLGALRMTMPRSITGRTQLWLQVKFAPGVLEEVLTPVRMDEVIVGSDVSVLRVAATYGNVRRFEVGTTETFSPR